MGRALVVMAGSSVGLVLLAGSKKFLVSTEIAVKHIHPGCGVAQAKKNRRVHAQMPGRQEQRFQFPTPLGSRHPNACLASEQANIALCGVLGAFAE
jgi:hypothetical protein